MNRSLYPAEHVRSLGQYAALMITMTTSCTLSMIGSSGIMYRTTRKGLDTVFRRLLFALSLSDMGCSMSLLLNIWLMPENTPGLYWANGNAASCQATGYLSFQFAICTAFVNAYLSLYFLFSVRYGWQDEDFTKSAEICGYSLAFLTPVAIGLAGIFTFSFNPQQFLSLCNWDVYPWGCEDDPTVECRGEASYILGWVAIFVLAVVSMIALSSVFLVTQTVKSRFKAGSRYSFSEAVDEEASQRLRRVKIQACLYCAVYFNSFIWPTIAAVVQEFISPESYADVGPFIVVYLCYLFYPLQGFGNFCVYTYPSIQRWRRADSELRFFEIMGKVLQGEEPDHRRLSSRPFRISQRIVRSIQVLRSSEIAQEISNMSGEISLAENSNTPTTNLNDDSASLAQSRRDDDKHVKHITIREVVEEEGSGSSGTTQHNNKDSKHVTINDDVEEDGND